MLDLIGEVIVGRTKQADDLDTTELTIRGGVRFHLLSRQRRLLFNEALPKRRLAHPRSRTGRIAKFFYSNDDPSESTVRFRNRLEINKAGRICSGPPLARPRRWPPASLVASGDAPELLKYP
jgi:hypothetical protein